MLLEGVGDVLEEDEAEDDVLVLRSVHVAAELVGGEPELGFETERGGGRGGGGGTGTSHEGDGEERGKTETNGAAQRRNPRAWP